MVSLDYGDLSEKDIAMRNAQDFMKLPKVQKLPKVENQDGGVGRHTAPPRTTRTYRKSNHKEVQHQGDKKETFIQTGRRGKDRPLGWRGLELPQQDKAGGGWDDQGRQSDH